MEGVMSMNIVEIAQHGLPFKQAGSMLLHSSIGLFFALSGWNKLTNKGRHLTFVKTLAADHIPMVKVMQWWVPGWELIAGAMLTLGAFSAFAAVMLLIICLVACLDEAKPRVEAFKPINGLDRVDDYLYLQEVLYSIVLLAIVLGV
jgi:putative oxidoreductase